MTELQQFKSVKYINKEMYGHPNAVFAQRPDGLIHFFVNFDIFKWLYFAYY